MLQMIDNDRYRPIRFIPDGTPLTEPPILYGIRPVQKIIEYFYC